jgi:hypothetical protein
MPRVARHIQRRAPPVTDLTLALPRAAVASLRLPPHAGHAGHDRVAPSRMGSHVRQRQYCAPLITVSMPGSCEGFIIVEVALARVACPARRSTAHTA